MINILTGIICAIILTIQLYVAVQSMTEVGKQYQRGLIPASVVGLNLVYHTMVTVVMLRGLFGVN